tara:strand:+ start:252 stop:497 length:246 start_codon:yes stop_codon:yes gene_type:complete
MPFCSSIRITIYENSKEELRERFDKTEKKGHPTFSPKPIGNRYMMSWEEKAVLEPPKRTSKKAQRDWGRGALVTQISRSKE